MRSKLRQTERQPTRQGEAEDEVVTLELSPSLKAPKAARESKARARQGESESETPGT